MSHKAAKRQRRQVKDDVFRVLRDVIGRLRRVLGRLGPGYYAKFPEAPRPCHSCAFNPGTDDWRGFDTTVLGLACALGERRPFFCHEGLPYRPGLGWTLPEDPLGSTRWLTEDGALRPCAGWWILQDDPDARRAFTRACAGRELDDDDADALAGIMRARLAAIGALIAKRLGVR